MLYLFWKLWYMIFFRWQKLKTNDLLNLKENCSKCSKNLEKLSLKLENPPGFCDSSSSLVRYSEDISSVNVVYPESNPSTVGDSESISSSSVTVVDTSEGNSLLLVNASHSNLPVTVANNPDSAPFFNFKKSALNEKASSELQGLQRPNTNRMLQLGNRYNERAIKKVQVLKNIWILHILLH